MLKIKFSKQKIIIEINWPTKPKEKKAIGPLFGKIKKNAIQVSKKACLVVISLGKASRGKWNQLTKKSLEFPADVDEIERMKNERIYRSIEKSQIEGNEEEEAPGVDNDIKKSIFMSSCEGGGRSISLRHQSVRQRAPNVKSVDQKYSHLPFFNRVKQLISKSVSQRKKNNFNRRKREEKEKKEGTFCFEEKEKRDDVVCEFVSISARSLETKGEKFEEIRSAQLKGIFSKIDKGKNPGKTTLELSSRALEKHIGRIKSPRKSIFSGRKRSLSVRKSSNLSQNNTRKAKERETRERVIKSLTPNKAYKNVKAKINTFRTATPTNYKHKTPRVKFKNGKKENGTKPFNNGKLSPKTEKSIKKFKKQIPLLKNELKMLLIKDKFSSEDYYSKESRQSKGNCPLRNLNKIVKNKKILEDIEKYESNNKEDKLKILKKLVKSLKTKLMEEQILRLERERELEVILLEDNKQVEFLVIFYLTFLGKKIEQEPFPLEYCRGIIILWKLRVK